jgi:hypothetical protein
MVVTGLSSWAQASKVALSLAAEVQIKIEVGLHR